MDQKYRAMTEHLRMFYSDEDVAGYLRWIITSETAKEFHENSGPKGDAKDDDDYEYPDADRYWSDPSDDDD